MQIHALFASVLASAALVAFADGTPSDSLPPAGAPAAAAQQPARRGMPPEAFTTPSNYVALVNVNGAVDSDWLAQQAAAMQRSLMVGVKAVDKGFAAPEGASADLRKQALGACCGAAYHPEREAVMRYSPTPESLDDCLSRNFHPLNSNAFSIVARAIGLDPVRLRPRKELVEMGILQPRAPKTQDAPCPRDEPAESR